MYWTPCTSPGTSVSTSVQKQNFHPTPPKQNKQTKNKIYLYELAYQTSLNRRTAGCLELADWQAILIKGLTVERTAQWSVRNQEQSEYSSTLTTGQMADHN